MKQFGFRKGHFLDGFYCRGCRSETVGGTREEATILNCKAEQQVSVTLGERNVLMRKGQLTCGQHLQEGYIDAIPDLAIRLDD